MMMKKIIYLLLLAFFFINCSHKITRIGYQKNSFYNPDCDITIITDPSYYNPIAYKVGEINIGESSFSVSCSEEKAIEILKKEACSLQADIIVIKHENKPDLWSKCYRCQADFYQLSIKTPENNLHSNKKYLSGKIKERPNKK